MVRDTWRVQLVPGLHVSIVVFTFIHACMHAFTLKMFVVHFWVPDAVLGTEYPGGNKTGEISALQKLTF